MITDFGSFDMIFARPIPLRLLAAAAALVLTLTAADCDDSAAGSRPDGQDRPAASAGPDPGCHEPGPVTRDLLPTFDAQDTTTIRNPCLSFVGLLANVRTLIPDDVPGFAGDLEKFDKGLGQVVNRVAKVADAVECGYEQDRLAIATYQNIRYRYSVGVVAVVNGDLRALIEGTACYLIKQVTLGLGDMFFAERPPHADFCFDATTRVRNGRRYTVIWAGSTDKMCGDLLGQLKPGRADYGGAVTATVKADPRIVVRAGPTTKSAIVGRVEAGRVVAVDCYLEGEQVSGRRGSSTRWDHLRYGELSGFVADVWLDTGGPIAQKVPRCDMT
ncbi:hypothetical protein [Catellatospora methionotrophica]|uniref:hypothetical protein n=1 Tax=Catellatospora methionotrophica TaxID=121620 RepID=UPI0033DCC3DA